MPIIHFNIGVFFILMPDSGKLHINLRYDPAIGFYRVGECGRQVFCGGGDRFFAGICGFAEADRLAEDPIEVSDG
jgi:hypothetical protein